MSGMRYQILLGFVFASFPALAYVGPGPGLSMLGSALGLIGAVLFALLVVIAYPLRLLYIKLRGKKKGEA